MEKEKRSRFSPFMKQCFIAAAVCLNIVGHGCSIGYPAVLLPQLRAPGSPIALTPTTESWIASVIGIALLVGNFLTPPIMDRFGRKAAHIAVIVPCIVGWFTMIMADTVEVIIIGRTFQGLSFGMMTSLRSVMLGEYTSPKNRGSFLATISLSQGFGIFFVHVLGSVLSWQRTALVCVFFSYASLIMTMYLPESPTWYLSKGKIDKCRKVFIWIRGEEENEELEEMIRTRLAYEQAIIERGDYSQSIFSEISDAIRLNEFYKPIILMMHCYFMLQFAGATVMAAYSIKILGHVMGPDANTHFWMIFLDVQRLISNTVAIFIIDKIKRRTMLFSVGGLCVGVHLTIAAYVYARGHGYLEYDAIWLPAVLTNIHIFTVAIGMVPLPSVIAGEVLPVLYRSLCGSISVISLAAFLFIALKTFPSLVEQLDLSGTYLVYAIILIYNLVVIWYMLPETKGKTLQEIEDEFRGRPLKKEEVAVRQSLQYDPVASYQRKMSARRASSPLLH